MFPLEPGIFSPKKGQKVPPFVVLTKKLTDCGKRSQKFLYIFHKLHFLYEFRPPGNTFTIFISLEGVCKGKWKSAV